MVGYQVNGVRSVHPRVCGEQKSVPGIRSISSGSSPRVRGTVSPTLHRGGRVRFIPACAGNRRLWRSGVISATVHPRVCGEQKPRKRRAADPSGSSPRVRGTVVFPFLVQFAARFIPACAGNRHQRAVISTSSAVHPRVCGEQEKELKVRKRPPGSSPRVRGTVDHIAAPPVGGRFIPACAGNRFSSDSLAPRISVHPRVCGEQAKSGYDGGTMNGSSPRVRGTGSRDRGWGGGRRFIPACAGNRA